ncbi:MAG: hypothetical protein OXC80_12335 [Gammaproteobacteria bacterium]|nr:hypothetical protein [Gammaproteobacteria bacterium]
MPIFKSYKAWKDAGSPPFEIDKPLKYGSVLGWVEDFETKFEINRWGRDIGIKGILRPFKQEAVLIRDPRNVVGEADFSGATKKVQMKCYIRDVAFADGERKSIYRHRTDRMCLTLAGPAVKRRYRDFQRMGFGSIYKWPIYVIKENPTQRELELADANIELLKERVPYLIITKEIWEKWR